MDAENILIERIAQRVVDKLAQDGMNMPGPDFTLPEVQKITGLSRSSVYATKFAGLYRANGIMRVRREELLYRRRMGMDLAD